MHCYGHIFKWRVLHDPLRLWRFLSFFFLIIMRSTRRVFHHLEFSCELLATDHTSLKFPKIKDKKMGTESSEQQLSSFSCLLFIKRKKSVVLHGNSLSQTGSDRLFQHVNSHSRLDQSREVWSLIQPQTGQATFSSGIFMHTPTLYRSKRMTVNTSESVLAKHSKTLL